MTDKHEYAVEVIWTGNNGTGTSGYRDYDRSFEVAASCKDTIFGSSDPTFRGDAQRWNPEELLVASLSACHKLWYLHLCADAGLVVTDYVDHASGTMRTEAAVGSGRFTEVVLQPAVTLASSSDLDLARELHEEAHKRCFIANSVNFPVHCDPTFSCAELSTPEQVVHGR